MREFFLGIDGGQSSTTLLIADEGGRVIGWARGGPCNHVAAAEAEVKFKRVITTCLVDACSMGGINPVNVTFRSACCGMSGGPADKITLLREVIRTEELCVMSDAEIALCGALGGRPGVVVIAGTGSICFGRNLEGKTARAGGWGYVFGDEGGAFDIVRHAVRAALRFEEGWGTQTYLSDLLLNATGAPDANQMMHLFYTPEWPRSRVAALAELVDSASMDGDTIARGILDQAAHALAMLAAAIRRVLFDEPSTVEVAYIGGVFQSHRLLERFRLMVELTDGCRCVAPAFDPAAGALLEAFKAASKVITLSDVPPLK